MRVKELSSEVRQRADGDRCTHLCFEPIGACCRRKTAFELGLRKHHLGVHALRVTSAHADAAKVKNEIGEGADKPGSTCQ